MEYPLWCVLVPLQYAPYKKGSKLSKARRAKQLGLESAAQALLQSPHTLDLRAWVKPGTKGTHIITHTLKPLKSTDT